jgi:hypothetical protein
MGDTAWFLLKLDEPEIDLYLSDTAEKGFNGTLVELGYYYFEPVGEPPFLNGDSNSLHLEAMSPKPGVSGSGLASVMETVTTFCG